MTYSGLSWVMRRSSSSPRPREAGSLSSTGTSSNSAYMGGIVGYSSSARSGVIIANNLSIGSLSNPSGATRSGALVGSSTSDASVFSNNYILQGLPITGSSTASTKIPVVVEVTSAQLTDGTLPEKLDANNWAQGTEYPIPQDREGTISEDELVVNGIKYEITGHNTVSVTYPNAEQPSQSNPCTYNGEITILSGNIS